MIPAEFFDQFPSDPPPQFQAGGYWCWRHWAPCPLLGANGLGATMELTQHALDEIIPAFVTERPIQVEKLNEYTAQLSPMCCRAGDEKMYEIWGHWPPAAKKEGAS